VIKLFKSMALLACTVALISCAAIVPSEHLIPKAQLASTMQKQFPLHWEKAGGLLSITIAQAQLDMSPTQNRIGLNGHYTAHAALFDIDEDFSSSSMLQYDSRQRAIFLQDISLDSFRLKQQGNRYTEMLRIEIGRILKDYALGHPIYRFKPDELKMLGVQVEVAGMSVVPEGIMLKLRVQ
jgi:hypothetical protein